MRYTFFSLFFCLHVCAVFCQTGESALFTREVSFTTENDAYLLQKSDAYYTNGFIFSLRTAKEKNGQKRIAGYELGQMIFTPLIRKTAGPQDIDRPYCGYLYLNFSQTRFLQKEAMLQFNLTVGEVGQASMGEDVQNGYHKLLNYARFTGWQYQVQNALGVDLGINYARTLAEDSSLFKLVPVVNASLGLNYTNASLGSYLCVGSFEKNSNSALWGGRVQTKATSLQRKYELFGFWYPQVIWQGYNATIQGGLLNKGNSGAVLSEAERWMFQHSIGICYAASRFTGKLAFIFQSKEAVTQKMAQQYGSFEVSYRLH